MSRVLAIAPVLLALLAAPAPAADDAKAVVQKAVKAHGGEEFLTKMKAAQASNKGKIKLPGIGEVEFTQEVSTMLPDKFKDSLEFAVMGNAVKVDTWVSGDAIAITVNGKDFPAPDEAKKALKDVQHMLETSRLVAVLKGEYDLALIGEVKVEDKPAVGVTVSKKGAKDISLFFDKETGLLAKLVHRTVEPGTGKEITEERIVQAYETKDGVPHPKKILVTHDGEKFLEAEVVAMKFLEKIDDGEFKK